MKRIFIQDHTPVNFSFRQNEKDFIVDEIPLENKNEKGNYLIAKIQKRNMSSMEMLNFLEEELHCYNVGYAGLKDKYATTTQYISVPLKFSKALLQLKHPQFKVLETFRSDVKLSMGDLKGNHFKIRLHQVRFGAAQQLQTVLDQIMREGMPNYFGYQRFGKEDDNFEKAAMVAHGEHDMKDKRINRMLSNAYQSYLFNDWLASRIKLSKEIQNSDMDSLVEKYGLTPDQITQLHTQSGLFRVLPGDIMLDMKTMKWENLGEDLKAVRKRIKERKLQPTGLLVGKKAWRAQSIAAVFEEPFDDMAVITRGDRRLAWVYPSKIRYSHDIKESVFELEFNLPKGSYATVLLENLANRDLTPHKER